MKQENYKFSDTLRVIWGKGKKGVYWEIQVTASIFFFFSGIHSISLCASRLKRHMPVMIVCHESKSIVNFVLCTWNLGEAKKQKR